ncbi:hypothetical protein C0992_009201 [Termitomyces sp. T32_za158]|nr:hypothetical protein C0992_009201 [Termitomyces sp. T32_za158]
MDSLHLSHFDSYPYSYASTPRTPSPHDLPYNHDYKQPLLEPRIYEADDYPQWSRGSLLQELYDHDIAEQQSPPQQLPPQQPLQHHVPRRATYPYVRHDRDFPPLVHYPISEAPEFLHDFDDAPPIKLEDPSLVVPSQSQPPFFPRLPAVSFLAPHNALHVQHTDDAASKETQYLRRRCFNCHTTEPPSWRRSTLNPGKIVCNKCGLYERTHLRPRPLRFDELRAGNKARANKSKTASPKQIKKEPREFGGLVRRSSVSSSSGSGTSDWDDNVSVYSSGSAPPTSFNSPSTHTFPLDLDLERDSNSTSPPRDGIRLPAAPLSDLALAPAPAPAPASAPTQTPASPRKAHSVPYCVDYFPPAPQAEWAPLPLPLLTASPSAAPIDLAPA